MSTRAGLVPAELPWRLRLGRVLDGHGAHMAVLLAIFVDVAAIVGETLLHSLCGSKDVHSWVTGLGWTSRAVLILLIVHQLALALAFGPLSYFRHPWYVFDMVVLIVSLVLELVLREDIEGGFLVLLLVWRGVRLIHGFAAEVHEGDEEKEHLRRHYEARIQELEQRLLVAERRSRRSSSTCGDGAAVALPIAAPPAPAASSTAVAQAAGLGHPEVEARAPGLTTPAAPAP